uniref:Putative ovule protein n=1 Tax=Solanum chacoense TaxID=4108 RepID=A0A0V0GZB2_SOLCH
MSSRINLFGQHIWYSCTFALIVSFIYFLNVFVVLRPNVVYLNLKVGDVRFLKSIRESSKVEHFEV